MAPPNPKPAQAQQEAVQAKAAPPPMEHAQAEQDKDYKAAPEAAAAEALAGKKGDAVQGGSNLEATLLNSVERPALEFHSNMSAAPMGRRFEDAALTQLSVSTPELSARPRRIDDEVREGEKETVLCGLSKQ